MALADNRKQRVMMFCALYVAQGVPWGFMLITLPSYLAYEFGVKDDEIGQLKAVILIPWSFKLIWAPLMDSFTIRSMGRRRPWIIGAELMMALTLLGMLGLGDLSQKLRALFWLYFLHNCFASLQDVCTDALALDVLPPEEQGRMNGLMWGSKLVGKGLGATGLAYVLRAFGDWGLTACVFVQFAVLLCIMLFPVLFLERNGERRFPWSPGQAMLATTSSNVRNPVDVLRDFFHAYSLTSTLLFAVFAVTKLIGMGLNDVVTNTLYTQQLGWKDVEFSTLAGVYVVAPQLAFTILGGFLADRFGRRCILTVGFGGFGLVAMLFAALPGMWSARWFATAYVLLSEGLLAAGSVGFLAMAMRISWTRAAATVFTTYMTLSNVSHVLGNLLAGPARSWLMFPSFGESANLFSYNLTYWLMGVVSLLPLLLLPWVRPDEVDRARIADASP